ncbi:HypC/HybG/HupF family hydrogenase formation chaperone [Patescibacteria group bacterium]|nr:HypC/HybG/HupF family hydrogenase formation chaperone [Patescibacteria group bacterium]MBU0964596.1 HypC/HybG/HupF family hydrogenase formation chaperone [Patescibacteria group bacterium]
MCLAIPHKIIKIRDTIATVECGQKTHTLDIRLTPKVKVGDYLMNENNFAIYKMTKKEAQETLKLFKHAK